MIIIENYYFFFTENEVKKDIKKNSILFYTAFLGAIMSAVVKLKILNHQNLFLIFILFFLFLAGVYYFRYKNCYKKKILLNDYHIKKENENNLYLYYVEVKYCLINNKENDYKLNPF